MGYTDDYLDWLVDKYGREGEDLEALLDRLGHSSGFDRMYEFARDHLADAVDRARDAPPRWDVFVSYDGEERDHVAAPLSEHLSRLGLAVWIDSEAYRAPQGIEGGILYRHLHEGIALSRIGVVIVSPRYVKKWWTTQEYFGIRRKGEGRLFLVLHRCADGLLADVDAALGFGARDRQAPIVSTADTSIEEIARTIAAYVGALPRS